MKPELLTKRDAAITTHDEMTNGREARNAIRTLNGSVHGRARSDCQ